MEPSTVKRKTFAQPRCLAELLPSLGGIFPEDAQHTFTDRKKPQPPKVQTLTADKVMRPMTYHEMRANLLALNPKSPKASLPTASSRKKDWVSSVKVDYKSVSHTANGQMQNNPVRKALNFQPKPKPPAPSNSRVNHYPAETPKFPKPEYRPKKSVYAQAKINNNVRISGIYQIPETPVETEPNPAKRMSIMNRGTNNYQAHSTKRMSIANRENRPYQASLAKRMTIANKENNPNQQKLNNGYPPKQNRPILPTSIPKKNPRKIDINTPVDTSSKSNDASFLQKEQEIQEQFQSQASKPQSHMEVLVEEPMISTPSSTPFKDYRSVQEYFNNSSDVENSALYQDNTIMSFDKPSNSKDSNKLEESIMVSLCDMFTKATVKTGKTVADLDALLEMKLQSESNIRMLESGIHMLNNIKKSQIESLKRVNKLIEEYKNGRTTSECQESEQDRTLVSNPEELPDNVGTSSKDINPIVSTPCSVIKVNHSVKSRSSTTSPTYKIPRKNSMCLRKTLVHKSMPNVSTALQTPVKDIDGKALNIYMKMKEQMNFLSTPMVNRAGVVPDTPMVTSQNLQKQLDKLYNGS